MASPRGTNTLTKPRFTFIAADDSRVHLPHTVTATTAATHSLYLAAALDVEETEGVVPVAMPDTLRRYVAYLEFHEALRRLRRVLEAERHDPPPSPPQGSVKGVARQGDVAIAMATVNKGDRTARSIGFSELEMAAAQNEAEWSAQGPWPRPLRCDCGRAQAVMPTVILPSAQHRRRVHRHEGPRPSPGVFGDIVLEPSALTFPLSPRPQTAPSATGSEGSGEDSTRMQPFSVEDLFPRLDPSPSSSSLSSSGSVSAPLLIETSSPPTLDRRADSDNRAIALFSAHARTPAALSGTASVEQVTLNRGEEGPAEASDTELTDDWEREAAEADAAEAQAQTTAALSQTASPSQEKQSRTQNCEPVTAASDLHDSEQGNERDGTTGAEGKPTVRTGAMSGRRGTVICRTQCAGYDLREAVPDPMDAFFVERIALTRHSPEESTVFSPPVRAAASDPFHVFSFPVSFMAATDGPLGSEGSAPGAFPTFVYDSAYYHFPGSSAAVHLTPNQTSRPCGGGTGASESAPFPPLPPVALSSEQQRWLLELLTLADYLGDTHLSQVCARYLACWLANATEEEMLAAFMPSTAGPEGRTASDASSKDCHATADAIAASSSATATLHAGSMKSSWLPVCRLPRESTKEADLASSTVVPTHAPAASCKTGKGKHDSAGRLAAQTEKDAAHATDGGRGGRQHGARHNKKTIPPSRQRHGNISGAVEETSSARAQPSGLAAASSASLAPLSPPRLSDGLALTEEQRMALLIHVREKKTRDVVPYHY